MTPAARGDDATAVAAAGPMNGDCMGDSSGEGEPNDCVIGEAPLTPAPVAVEELALVGIGADAKG